MSPDRPEPELPTDAKKAKRPSFCKVPNADWISWEPVQSQSERWSRLGAALTIAIALGLLWIVWLVWPLAEWVKPATSEIEMKENRRACRAIAFEKDPLVGGNSRGSRYAAAYKTCMESKGYSLTK